MSDSAPIDLLGAVAERERQTIAGKLAVIALVRSVLRAEPATLPDDVRAAREEVMQLQEKGGAA